MAISLNVNDQIDVSKVYSGGAYVPAGWYKLALVGEEEERRASSGRVVGAFFIFNILDGTYSGRQLKFWFATRALASDSSWQVEKTSAICLRIAQAAGLSGRLQNTSQLYNKPFYAELTLEKSESKTVNDETGATESKTYWNNSFPGKKAPLAFILSPAEYNGQAVADVPADAPAETPERRKIIRKAAQPVQVVANDEEEVF